MRRTSYDLRNEAWVPVRRVDGSDDVLSLRDVFAQAHELTAVTGEVPTSSVALLRLLLAVLHRSLPDEPPIEQWRGLWEADQLPADEINGYLNHVGERFDLLSPLQPFLQVAALATTKGQAGPLSSLIVDVPNRHPFFTGRSGAGLATLDFAEAARWLVHCQAYDPSGIKSGALGDPRVKGGKGFPIGTSWAGGTGAVVVEGTTLRETLLLNLALLDRAGNPWPSDDTAVWERDPLGPGEESSAGRPRGPVDLLTWPSRRLRLQHDGERVTGVLVCQGDPLRPERGTDEPMTAWRRSLHQEKKLGSATPVYLPLSHAPERSLWRGLAGLLTQQTSPAPADGERRLPPLNLVWLRRLADQGVGPDPQVALRTRAVGISYGSNNSVVDDMVDDALVLHAVLLGRDGSELRATALEAVQGADLAAQAVGHLAGNLALATGASPDQGALQRDGAREAYYFSLDTPFRGWLAGLVPASDPEGALREWQRSAADAARSQEQLLLLGTGPAAWVGRTVTSRTGSQRVDAGLASLWFRSALAKALPLAVPTPTPTTVLESETVP